jgi:hypothetical protein
MVEAMGIKIMALRSPNGSKVEGGNTHRKMIS